MTIERAKEILGPIRLHCCYGIYFLDQKPATIGLILRAAQERLMQVIRF